MSQTGQHTPTRDRVEAWVSDFSEAIAARDAERVASMFAEESYWRDLIALTWNVKTVESRTEIAEMLRATLAPTAPGNFTVIGEPTEANGVAETWLSFDTKAGRGTAHLRLVDGQAWTLLTTLDELKGHEEAMNHRRPKGTEHAARPHRLTWGEERAAERRELGHHRQPEVVIVGGGQGGIALGARLRQLGVSTIIVERNERPGDSWRNRYKSLVLHDPVWYDHLPYLKFPDTWPVFTPKDKIADWLEMYTQVMDLNYWGSTTALSAKYDKDNTQWELVVDRDGEQVTLRPSQLVMALGVSGKPHIPSFPGQDRFRGEQHHSTQHPGPDAYAGKKAVVIGSNNSAHDICAALWEHGADVTMVQRSSTHIVRSDSLREHVLKPLYSEAAVDSGIDTRTADLTFASMPYRILNQFQKPAFDAIRKQDADFYDRLEKAGFQLDFGADDSGMFLKYLRRGSGYYIDVGAAELVANGSIKLARSEVSELTETEVVLANGTRLEADLLVYATGFGSMNGLAADIVGQEVADKVGKVWGLGSNTTKDPGPWEGEERNMWKPTQQQGLWFHGGNLHQSRHYSLYLALQLKARAEGLPTPVYGLQEVHHTS